MIIMIIKKQERQRQLRLSNTTPTTDAEDLDDKHSYYPSASATTIAKVAVMANTGVKVKGTGVSISVSMPIASGKTVEFASVEEIIFALGIPEMGNPIPAGIIQTTNGLQVPITLDISYLAGPVNRFVPKSHDTRIMNPVAEQIMRTVIVGGARETILFSAQQFKSATDYRLQENTGLHITAKVGLSELSTKPYSMLDESTKNNIARLNKGELVMIHSAFRHPIKISFPKGAFMRLK